ncbi:Ribosomal protein S18 acetylase RimI [Pseudomonas sp. NFACC19-2]|uniref:GNAT family N-acetyltransferase n=1 Tax=Ectopseudomonas toyotomiensis TaxID=554344 RepID=A0A1I5RLE9_9GAMM|nr:MULTISPECIES: GNAT family N-acetyltransferase [Pseudomonas]PIA74561.1 N-acetyltransferase [Pseudomonas toyotomiensis]QSL92160.1 GNAT family N-acetyltransferase [Pseudomonas toyotomiensis]SDA83627.1 Ribosomal protein S18 acetylase RimI [Pseudomonas sp. NFPP33]SFP59071.1 Ribosomal protein S18 acetylase RimI [Pseudomonas toyotomiensis]SFW45006.1 Ribosomal protein S18 acetylase RimI [Pseudomonas sp. NFACC19-2]
MLSPYVREARAEDVPALLPLMRELARFEDYLEDFAVDEVQLMARAFAAEPQCRIFVAEASDRLLGYAVTQELTFTYDLRPTVRLKELYVAPDARCQRLGEQLLAAVARWAKARGAGRLKWDVLAGNQKAERFYQRLGGHPDAKWIAYTMDHSAMTALAEYHCETDCSANAAPA